MFFLKKIYFLFFGSLFHNFAIFKNLFFFCFSHITVAILLVCKCIFVLNIKDTTKIYKSIVKKTMHFHKQTDYEVVESLECAQRMRTTSIHEDTLSTIVLKYNTHKKPCPKHLIEIKVKKAINSDTIPQLCKDCNINYNENKRTTIK